MQIIGPKGGEPWRSIPGIANIHWEGYVQKHFFVCEGKDMEKDHWWEGMVFVKSCQVNSNQRDSATHTNL
jgi:hypothetical protein